MELIKKHNEIADKIDELNEELENMKVAILQSLEGKSNDEVNELFDVMRESDCKFQVFRFMKKKRSETE